KNLQKSTLAESLSDVRVIGMIAFGIVALLVTWSGIKVLQTNYDLQKQISKMQQENEVKKLENSNLALENQFLETDEYLELTARRQYNKASPGEKLLIVPKSIALSHTTEVATDESKEKAPEAEDAGPWY